MVEFSKAQVAIIGAGPAGLMAAEVLARGGAGVTVYDAMPSVGRKFLLAGRGGLNLTHSEPLPAFLTRYGAAASRLAAAIEHLSPQMLRGWSEGLGQTTFVGSSGRVFPQTFKASPLLRAWLRRLDAMDVKFALRHRWNGWDRDSRLLFQSPDGDVAIEAASTVLALGGASWPRLGSDGAWTRTLADKGVSVAPLRPANCGFAVAWSPIFRDRFEGHPLKSVTLSFGQRSIRGDAVITRNGIEGGGIYALSAPLRDEIINSGKATLNIALRPDIAVGDLAARLGMPRGKQSFSNYLRKAVKLSPVDIGLLQQVSMKLGAPLASLPATALAELINAVPVELEGVAPIERAISVAGGLSFDELDLNYMIRRLPGVFAAGEMLDWEAPTGGYLLQASFATGAAAGRGALKWIQH